MKASQTNSARASTIPITLSTGLISISAILLGVAAPTITKNIPRQDRGGFQLKERAAGDSVTAPSGTPSTCPEINFATPRNFGVGQYTYSVAVGDFNGDGKQDLATANEFSNNVSILLGDGAGHFSPATNYSADDGPKSLVVSDFNGDGKQDVAVANFFSGDVSILLGDGTGHFSATTNFAVGSFSRSVAVGDFNTDGKQDLAVAGDTSGKVAILLGDGMGHFSAPANFVVGSYPESIAVGDFNHDGNQDLAVANSDSANVSILLGDGTGHFNSAASLATGRFSTSVAVGEFNADGNQDLAVGHYDSADVSILLGDGMGHFSTPTNFGAGDSARSVTVGDFNGDGKQDLAVADNDSANVSILPGDGAGHFSAPINFLAGSGPLSIAPGDFNGDSLPDLAVANSTSNNVSILLRTCTPRPAPLLTHFAVTASEYAFGGFQFYLSVAAKDQFNTTVPGYTGTVHFTASCLAYLPPDSQLPNGMSTFMPTLNQLGYQTITVTDIAAPSITGTSNPVFVMMEGPPPPPPTPQPTPTGTPPATPTATATGTPTPTPPATPTPLPCVIASLRENFDTATAPALPAGWHSSSVPGPASCAPGGICPFDAAWLTNTTFPQSSPNCAFHDAPGCVTDSPLDTFSFEGRSGSFLQFYHSYNLEAGHDGGVLEISINGGPFVDFIAAGGSFIFGGYNGTIATGFQSPIEGRQAWTGQSEGYVGAAATLPAAAWLQNVTLRFRLATDCITSSPGWRIDDVEVVFLIPCATPTPTPPTIVVTTTADGGPGSLRQAIADAHKGDIIGFDPSLNGQTISLTSGELMINQDISINGPGSDLLSVSRSPSAPGFRVIHIMPGHTVAIQGLTITGGRIDKFDPSFAGAGIFNEQGTLTIDSCTVSSNFNFYSGGGISNRGTLTVSHSTINSNFGGFGGGGISNSGMLTIMNSTVRNNTSGLPQGVGGSSGVGAGIENGGMATIVGSTIDHNTANGSNQGSLGGGIFSGGFGSLTISNSTISQNVAGIQGGAISGGGSITNCTISGNRAPQGGGISVNGTLQIDNTILNTGANGANIHGGTVTSHGYNLSNDNGAGSLTGPGDQINTDPLLGPLQNNGGPTFTHEVLPGSPALNAGDPAFTPPPFYDQRGPDYDRVFSGRLDIGAFEVQSILPTPTPTPTTTPTPTPTTTPSATPTPTPAHFLNLSTRLLVQTGDRVGIGGFIITGPTPKQVVARGIGPSLAQSGVPNALADPVLELHGPAGFTTIINDNWRNGLPPKPVPTGLEPTNDLESFILVTLDPGAYTAILRGKNNASGVGLVEIYDLGPATSQFANISTRGFVGTGSDVVIGGFILGGGHDTHIVVRGLGPSLAAFGIPNPLPDPTLELHDANGILLTSNDNCDGIFVPPDPAEACVDISLSPGALTAILAGKNGGTGIGLLEIYNLQ